MPGRRQSIAEARENITQIMGWSSYLSPDAERTPRMTDPTPEGAPLVYRKWSDVMVALGGIAKRERAQAGRTSFNFRGIDAVMNAVGPLLREHGLSVFPRALNITRDEHESKSGGRMVNTVAEVEYTVYAKDGSTIVGSAFGEASDAGDKSVPKAMSVAYRTFLLQALTIPTDEPDPDTHIYERASAPQQAPRPDGPPIDRDTIDAIQDLFEALALTPEDQRAGIIARGGRDAPLADLTQPEGERVLLALQRKMQAQQAAPTPEEAEDRVRRALGATPVEEGR